MYRVQHCSTPQMPLRITLAGRSKVAPIPAQTCKILSSATEASTQSSLGFQEKSDTLLVWPPWMNMSSGGPSSASSGACRQWACQVSPSLAASVTHTADNFAATPGWAAALLQLHAQGMCQEAGWGQPAHATLCLQVLCCCTDMLDKVGYAIQLEF